MCSVTMCILHSGISCIMRFVTVCILHSCALCIMLFDNLCIMCCGTLCILHSDILCIMLFCTLYIMCCNTCASQACLGCSYEPRPQQTCLAAMLSCYVCLWASPLPTLLLLSTRKVLLPAPVYQLSRLCRLLLSTRLGRQWVSPVALLVPWQAKQLPMGADTMTAVQLLHRPHP